jgi:mRNA interferase RelE/StbE
MSYAISVGKKARKFLCNLNDAKLRSRLEAAIDSLAENPHPPGHKVLKGAEGLCRVRVGDYRILYAVQEERLFLLVVSIGHRRDVYR